MWELQDITKIGQFHEKSRTFNPSSALPILPSFHLQIFWNHSSAHMSYPQGHPWHFSDECHSAFEHLKGLSPTAPVLTHWILDTQITVKTDTSDYALATVLSITTPMATCTLLHSTPGLFLPQNSTMMSMTKSYLQFFKLSNDGDITSKALDFWRCGHWSPEFAILFNGQNPHMSKSTLVWIPLRIQPCNPFPSWKTRNQPDPLTRRWDIYLKEGNSNYASVNPQNYCLVFTSEQLPLSLQATTLSTPVLHGSLIMDAERLHSNICSHSEMILFSQSTLTISQTPSGPSIPMVYYTTSDASMFQTLEISDYVFSSTHSTDWIDARAWVRRVSTGEHIVQRFPEFGT